LDEVNWSVHPTGTQLNAIVNFVLHELHIKCVEVLVSCFQVWFGLGLTLNLIYVNTKFNKIKQSYVFVQKYL
jgi:hypothetical protein